MDSRKPAPFTPHDAANARLESMPACVINAFNYLLARYYFAGKAHITEEMAIDEIIAFSNNRLASPEVRKRRYLDVEDIYREYGWEVEYKRPSYDESFKAHYIFKRKI